MCPTSAATDPPPIIAWCPRPDLNRNTRFRKPLLYPVELRGPEFNLQRDSAKTRGKPLCGEIGGPIVYPYLTYVIRLCGGVRDGSSIRPGRLLSWLWY